MNAILNEHWLINEIKNVIVLTNYYYWKFKSIVDMKYAYVINSPISYKKNFYENIREIKTYWTWIKPSILRKNIKWLKCKYYFKTMVTELIKIFFHIKINLQSETKVAQS